MVSLVQLHTLAIEHPLQTCDFQTQSPLNLYDSPACTGLSTQALAGRYLRFSEGLPATHPDAIQIRLREDHYPGWVRLVDLEHIELAAVPYQAPTVSAEQIQARIPAVIAFAQATLTVTNTYLWGGTLGPNYDCSGLMQRAYGSQGIWLPRDSYQQQDFTTAIANPGTTPTDIMPALQPGDLLFFGSPTRTDHVALYLGEGAYLHSSGQERGRNAIAIDRLDESDPVRSTYYQRFRGAGRVTNSYRPPQ